MKAVKKTIEKKSISTRIVLRFDSAEQKEAISNEAKNNDRTINSEILSRCFSYDPKVLLLKKPVSNDFSFTLRFDSVEQKTQLINSAEKNRRSLNAEILYRCFRGTARHR